VNDFCIKSHACSESLYDGCHVLSMLDKTLALLESCKIWWHCAYGSTVRIACLYRSEWSRHLRLSLGAHWRFVAACRNKFNVCHHVKFRLHLRKKRHASHLDRVFFCALNSLLLGGSTDHGREQNSWVGSNFAIESVCFLKDCGKQATFFFDIE
jgi:hypothetical protein